VDILLILLPIALALGALFVGLFAHAARHGQFDDLDDPPLRMLFDDAPGPPGSPGEGG
jgi:cbb3-type cytochrome oxidase maturation protein